MKGKRGITLIALIITIIVMLILVAVTINIAISGGLFGTAKKAVRKTDIAKLMEEWMMTKYADYNTTTGRTNVPDGPLSDVFGNKYEQYNDQFAIENGELVYIGTNEEIRQYVQELGGTIEPTKGSINIKLFYSYCDGESISTESLDGGEFDLYRVGIRNNGNFYISPELQSHFPTFTQFPSPNISDPPTPSVDDLKAAARTVPSALLVEHAGGTPEDGIIFDNLDCGVFVVSMAKAPDGYNLIPPRLVSLPSLENRTDKFFTSDPYRL